MAQAFVRSSDLNNDPVPVIAFYDDGVSIDRNAHGNNVVVLHLPQSALEYSLRDGLPTITLAKNWRSYKTTIIADEASRRIEEAFPEEAQSASALELVLYILQYGADAAKWPSAAQERKAEADRGLNYIKAVRIKRDQLEKGTLPANPNADSVWPTRIKPYQQS